MMRGSFYNINRANKTNLSYCPVFIYVCHNFAKKFPKFNKKGQEEYIIKLGYYEEWGDWRRETKDCKEFFAEIQYGL